MQRILLPHCAQPLTRLPELSTLKMSHLNCRSKSQRAQHVPVCLQDACSSSAALPPVQAGSLCRTTAALKAMMPVRAALAMVLQCVPGSCAPYIVTGRDAPLPPAAYRAARFHVHEQVHTCLIQLNARHGLLQHQHTRHADRQAGRRHVRRCVQRAKQSARACRYPHPTRQTVCTKKLLSLQRLCCCSRTPPCHDLHPCSSLAGLRECPALPHLSPAG